MANNSPTKVAGSPKLVIITRFQMLVANISTIAEPMRKELSWARRHGRNGTDGMVIGVVRGQ
jgi:hypothetical protein